MLLTAICSGEKVSAHYGIVIEKSPAEIWRKCAERVAEIINTLRVQIVGYDAGGVVRQGAEPLTY